MVAAGPGLKRVSGTAFLPRQRRWPLPVAAAVCAVAFAAYLVDAVLLHSPGHLLDWYDLNVYNHGGLIARNAPRARCCPGRRSDG